MRYAIASFLLLSLAGRSAAQAPDLLLLPEWKEGQYRTYMVQREGGWPDEPQELTLDTKLEVVGYNIVAYDLDLAVRNFMIDLAGGASKDELRDLEEVEWLHIGVSVNKKNGEYTLTGVEDAGEAIEDAFKMLTKFKKAVDKEAATAYSEEWSAFAERMADHEDLATAWFRPIVDLMTLPLCRSYYLGDTVRNEVEMNISLAADSIVPAVVWRRAVLTDKDREGDEATVVELREHPVPPDPDMVAPEDAPEPEFLVKGDLEITYELKEAWPKEGRYDLATTPKGATEPHTLRLTVTQTGRSKK